jgi:hypothetical protein
MVDVPGIDLWMESTRSLNGKDPHCLMRWNGHEKYVLVADVRRTAEDLITCAAYADMISELMRKDFESHLITAMIQATMRDGGKRDHSFGGYSTMFLLPGGSSAKQQGMVLIGRRDQFHKGKTDGVLLPDDARDMAWNWMAAAEASEADTLFSAVLERAGWMDRTEMNAVFDLLMDIRSGNADLPPVPTGQDR